MPLLLALAPAIGLIPAHRDLVDFFLPLRTATASSVASGIVPWINFANGCGEAWFANPETAVFYPPAWLHVVVAPQWALTLEIAFHLAWLSLGAGLVARHLGAGRIGISVVEVASWSAGPMIFTAGVLNNLETVAWAPWMVLAARTAGNRAVPLVAITTACAWLGGEPQMWAMAVVLAVVCARSRAQVVAGAALGALIVSFQIVPFLFWVLEGDRGPRAASWVLRGAVAPADWSGLLVPGLPIDPDRMIYVESFFIGAPLLVCGLLGVWSRKWVLVVAGLLGLLATMPEIGGGGVFLALTGGLVRYPSRFALAGLALLLPMMGVGVDAWLSGKGRWLAVGVASATLLLCMCSWHPLRWWVAGLPAALMLVGAASAELRGVRVAALVGGAIGTVIAAVPLLGFQPVGSFVDRGPVWPEARNGGRIYSPAPSEDVMRWFATGMEPRRLWPVGYLNLVEGLTVARTDSPVANGRLMDHLEIVDQGPENRWWLDVLAAKWVILREAAGVPDNMKSVRVRGGMRLLLNQQAASVVTVATEPPRAETGWQLNGGVDEITLEANSLRATVNVVRDGFLWVAIPPVRGWRWMVDGARVELEQGPGIVSFLPITAGGHVLVGHYRPPGLAPAAAVSGGAVIVVAFLLWRDRRRDIPAEG